MFRVQILPQRPSDLAFPNGVGNRIPASGHGFKVIARWAAMMLPPDTELTCEIRDNRQSSFIRRSAPR